MTSEEELEYYKKALEREKQAKREAEKILEQKARELYEANSSLKELNANLEKNLQARVDELRMNEERIETFVKNASDVIYQTDEKGYFTRVNKKAEDITGYTADELIGKHFLELVDKSDHKRIIAFYKDQVKFKQDSSYFEFRIITKSGRKVWLGQNVQILFDDSKNITFQAIARNITDKVEALDSLRMSEEKYRSLLENMKLGILEVSNDGKIIKANDSFCELTGYKRSELIDRDANELFLNDELKGSMIAQEELRRVGKASVYEMQINKKNGEPVWILISGAPFYDSNGRVEGSIGIHLDITERKKVENELIEAEQRAQESSKAKELFLANMSHEIRTPLNAVIGISQLISNTDLNSLQSRYIETIKKSANNLLSLVNNILDFSKIESGNLDINIEPVNLFELLSNVVETLSYSAQSKGLKLSFENALDKNQYYLSDSSQLTQVCVNLLNNAIKFTDSGFVKLSVEVLSENKKSQLLRISIKDSGPGISEENKQVIFNEFERTKNSSVTNIEGTGLGLSICKKIIDHLDGVLKLDSEVGYGSTFYFDISLKKADNIAFLDFAKKQPSIDLSNVSILLAEDNKVNQIVAEGFLNNYGAKLDICENGIEVIEKLKTANYDIVLMDIQMPKMNGIDCTHIIRTELNLEVPIIALTANAVKNDKELFLQAGMNGYISKPYTESNLLSSIQSLLFPETESEGNQKESKTLELDKIKKLGKGDDGFVTKMLKIFLDESKELINRIENTENPEEISRIAHRVKPSFDYLTNQELRSSVRSIEAKEFINDQDLLLRFIENWKSLLVQVRKELQD